MYLQSYALNTTLCYIWRLILQTEKIFLRQISQQISRKNSESKCNYHEKSLKNQPLKVIFKLKAPSIMDKIQTQNISGVRS